MTENWKNNKEYYDNVPTFIENFFILSIICVVLFFLVGSLGWVVLEAFDLPVYNMFYNFVFGLGIIATGTFIVAVLEELRK